MCLLKFLGADRRDVLSGAELRQVMVGHLEKGTAGKLGWRRRLALRLAGPILRNLKKPTMLRRLAGLWMPLGKKVAIIGGDFVTCELAEFLVNRGRQVTILAGQQELAVELAIPSKWILMNSLVESGSPCSPKWNARR